MKKTKYQRFVALKQIVRPSGKKLIFFSLLLLSIALVLSACSPEDTAAELADAEEIATQSTYVCPVKGHHSFGQGWGAGRNHKGVDLIAAERLPLVAVTDGVVDRNKWFSAGGHTTRLRGNDGFYYYYAHLREPGIRSGAVRKGDIIGYVGATGNASGPHLHFERRTGPSQGSAQSNIKPFTQGICSGPQVDIHNVRVFNWRYYLGKYPDLRRAGLRTASQARAHWRDYGLAENRRGSAEFQALAYYNRYRDLRRAFPSRNTNERNKQLIDHYLTYGIKEKRSGR